MNFAPITHELWNAFVEERKCWTIVELANGSFVATDRQRYNHGEAFANPVETTFTQEICPDRESAAYYIGIRTFQAVLEKTGIIHANA